MDPLLPIIISTVFTAVVGFISWYQADTQSKVRATFVADKVDVLEKKHDKDEDSMDKRVTDLEATAVQLSVERLDLRRELERVDNTKASKDVVDNFRNEITNLKLDMDKRFDRIERLLERVTSPRKGNIRLDDQP